MDDDRVILNANLGRTNIVEFKDFYDYAKSTLTDIIDVILPICGPNALSDLVVYKNQANEFINNIFSNDGIHILKSMEYMSPIQVYIVNYVRYIAQRVERAASDGTSTAIYLTSCLLLDSLAEIYNIRQNKVYKILQKTDDRPDTIERNLNDLMGMSHTVADTLTQLIDRLIKNMESISIDLREADPELREQLIYRLANTTCKGDVTLSNYAVTLFRDLPEVLYEHTVYRRSEIETDENFIVDQPEHDLHLTVVPSNNIIYNSKLGTELLYESCDILFCPSVAGKVDELLRYLTKRKGVTDQKLVIVFNGADDTEMSMLERSVDHTTTVLCRQTAFHPMFVNNPLELKVAQAMSGLDPVIQGEAWQFETTVTTNVKVRLYGSDLYCYRLFADTHLPLHPSYVLNDNPGYYKLQTELEDRIKSLQAAHNQKDVRGDLNEFIRVYRTLICSRLPILTIGGSTVNHLANINVVDDVLGVVSVAMKHGVIIDLIPKLAFLWKYESESLIAQHGYPEIKSMTSIPTHLDKLSTITYGFDNLSECVRAAYLSTDFSNLNEMSLSCVDDEMECKRYGDNHPIKVVQSTKAIVETLKRLSETIPKFICTDRIIVPRSVAK